MSIITVHVDKSLLYLDAYEGFIAVRIDKNLPPIYTLPTKIHRDTISDAQHDADLLKASMLIG